jgi:hypothetical protein
VPIEEAVERLVDTRLGDHPAVGASAEEIRLMSLHQKQKLECLVVTRPDGTVAAAELKMVIAFRREDPSP